MKLIIERLALLRSLSHIQSVVERRNTIPILSNVKLTAQEDCLDLNATDMDLDIVVKVPTSVSIAGATTAPAHTLYEIVRKLPEGSQVELESEENSNQLILRAARSNFTITCLSPEDFPVMGGGDPTHSFSILGGNLRALIDRTRFAISMEETRYYLNGIYFHTAQSDGTSVLRVVATDGHRLASVETVLPEGASDMPGVIIPRKAVTELRKLLDDCNEEVEVTLSESKIRFTVNESVLTSKLIDGTFPDYQRVIPEGNDKHLDVDTEIFGDAVDRVSAISNDKSRAVKMKISPGMLTLIATSNDIGSASEDLEVAYNGEEIEVGFNSRYLLDIAQQIEGATMRFVLSDSASPTIIREIDDSSTLYVLMPMRV